MDQSPRVTVAIPTWNRAYLVQRAIRSALAQTFREFEVLVVDDGSSDGTPQVVAEVGDPRLAYVRHEENGGISRARNTALARARGEWIAFLDDDNEWAPDYLERQLAFAASRPGADMVYCRARRHDTRARRHGLVPSTLCDGRVFRQLLTGWVPLMSSALLRRSVVIEVGGLDERLGATEDRDLCMRLAQRTDFAGNRAVLVVRHEHLGRQLSRNCEILARDAAVMDEKWALTVRASCGRLAYRRWRAELLTKAELCRAMRAAEAGQRGEGARSAWRMARLFPWSAPRAARAVAVTVLGLPTYRRLVAAAWARPAFRGAILR
ncbi:MAG TPA: glycosyltransferase family 2 protein [Candidatus Methylomirabilis sp.]|nr:glycosyltransferase family 2 protein [Candidatus Methylomirabilis sp.]